VVDRVQDSLGICIFNISVSLTLGGPCTTRSSRETPIEQIDISRQTETRLDNARTVPAPVASRELRLVAEGDDANEAGTPPPRRNEVKSSI